MSNRTKRNIFLDRLAVVIIVITFIVAMIVLSIIIGYGGPWYAYLIWPALCSIITIIVWALDRLAKF